jgi:Fe2+ transport system protein B
MHFSLPVRVKPPTNATRLLILNKQLMMMRVPSRTALNMTPLSSGDGSIQSLAQHRTC